jgi:CubicO group peptidase (beta-lactamase class C family)
MASAQSPSAAQVPADPPAPALDTAQLEAYVDGMVEGAMKSDRIPGVGLAVVRNGAVVLLKGYGQANAAGAPVNPERTLFRIASISKTFTWIAVMQQVEAGRIGLERPVNDYLPAALRIPDDGYKQPILVRHLMTHSAGFEDLVAGHLFIEDPERALPLEAALARHRPRRVRPPGIASVYSNYGTALAGAIVQQVTGLAFEDYVEQRILTPLALQNTTFREPYAGALVQARGLPSPMTPALAADVADGFRWRDGGYVAQPFEHVVQFAPAGAASTTPADMARYMIALMAGGAGVLKPSTVALFAREKPLFANAPGINGVAFGMLQSHSEGGWRAWGHDGDTLHFHSRLSMFPDLGLGVFVTVNSSGGGTLRHLLPNRIADRIAGRNPAFAAAPAPDPAAQTALRKFAGAYLLDRRAWSNAERAFCIINCTIAVTVTPDGRLAVASRGQSARLAPLAYEDRGKGLRIHRFRNLDSGETAAFEERNGHVVAYFSPGGVNRARRVSLFGAPDGFFSIVAIGLIGAFAAAFSGLSRVFSAPQQMAQARAVGLFLPLAGAMWIATLVSYGAYFQRAASDEWTVFADWPGQMRIGGWASVAAAGFTALAVLATALAWFKADWSVWRRTRIVATLGALIALALVLNAWNLVGPRF